MMTSAASSSCELCGRPDQVSSFDSSAAGPRHGRPLPLCRTCRAIVAAHPRIQTRDQLDHSPVGTVVRTDPAGGCLWIVAAREPLPRHNRLRTQIRRLRPDLDAVFYPPNFDLVLPAELLWSPHPHLPSGPATA